MSKIKIHIVLKRLFEKNHTTLSKVAKVTGIPKSTISTFMLPTARPTNVEQVQTLSKHFGISMSELLFDEPESAKSLLDSLKTEMAVEGLFKLKLERVILPGDEGGNK